MRAVAASVAALLCCIGPAFAAAAPPAVAPPPAASFRVILALGVAPCAIHVDATRCALAAGTPLTGRYDWDFGDPGSKYNQLQGFVAAHLYRRPGRYRIGLTVTDEAGAVRSAFASIVIAPSDRRTLFVSPDGDDSNPGNQPEVPLRTAQAAIKRIRSAGAAVLFQAGRVHVLNDSLLIEHTNITLDRYGPGADPVLMHTQTRDPSITCAGNCDGLLVEHLTFDTPYAAPRYGPAGKIGVDAIDARGRNIVLNQCTFLNLDDAINANGNPIGLLVQDCRAPLDTGLRAYFVWGQGSDHAYLGNMVANSTREHCIRMFGLNRVLIADNDLTNLDRSQEGDPHDANYFKGCIECQRGSYYYVTHNRVTTGQVRVGPLGVTEPPGTATDWDVIDGNTVNQCHIIAYAGAHHVMIRNNLVYNDNNEAISINGADVPGRRISGDLTVVNNTAVNNGTRGTFLFLGGHVDGLIVKNNLLVAPHFRSDEGSAFRVSENNLSDFTAIAHDVWPAFGGGRINACSIGGRGRPIDVKQWAAEPVVKQDAFADVELKADGEPAGGLGLLNTAEPVFGVWADHDGRLRPRSGITIGAFQLPGAGARGAATTAAAAGATSGP